MKIEQVAIQLYTLRDYCKTEEDLDKTLSKVASIGYPAVQISGVGPIPEEKILSLCEKYNLELCATHEPGPTILDQPEAVVERLKKLECQYTAYPYPSGIDFGSKESVNDLIAKLDKAGEVLAKAGQVLTYHNHEVEFRKMDGKCILDKIYGETNPKHLQGEIDTYWVQHGGGDPVAWCRKLEGRLPLLHLKDFVINSEKKITSARSAKATSTSPLSLEPPSSPAANGSSSSRTLAPATPSTASRSASITSSRTWSSKACSLAFGVFAGKFGGCLPSKIMPARNAGLSRRATSEQKKSARCSGGFLRATIFSTGSSRAD